MRHQEIIGLWEAYQQVHSQPQEEVEKWVNSLIEEGYDLSEYTWDDMVEIYLGEEYRNLPIGRMIRQAAKHGQRGGMAHMAQKKVEKTPIGLRTLTGSRERAKKLENIKKTAYTKAAKMTIVAQDHDPRRSQERASQNRARGTRSNIRPFVRTTAESFDLFDIILEHLVVEGYADTNEAALVIMANMSEEWRESIVEGGFPGTPSTPRAGDAGTSGLKLIRTPTGQTGYINKHSGGEILPSGTVNKIMSGQLMVKNNTKKNNSNVA